MQKLTLNQTLQQRLSPQQIQFIKLLQIPTAELNQRIEQELEINPALEEGMDMELSEDSDKDEETYENVDFQELENNGESIDIQDYINRDDFEGYKMQGDGWQEDDRGVLPIISTNSLAESLLEQLGYLKLSPQDEIIGRQIIGSVEEDGYLRRSLRSICNDLAFTQNLYIKEAEVERILSYIQRLEPVGIAARSLQECLLLQLKNESVLKPHQKHAIEILEKYYDEFTRKHFDKIQRRMSITAQQLHDAMGAITRLNPKPGSSMADSSEINYIIPDFIVTSQNGKLEIFLNSKNAPSLRISRNFSELLDTYDKSQKNNRQMKETVTFIKQKLDSAKWFIDAIKQRQQTLLKTMTAIVHYQRAFFEEGDESRLRPMILKDIADKIGMEISTVSRVANSKAVQTDFGIYQLKYFFSEGIATDSGEDASSREVKNILKELIDEEPKSAPLSDDKLEKILNKRGYNIARRTVAKYREQLNIPVARLRRTI